MDNSYEQQLVSATVEAAAGTMDNPAATSAGGTDAFECILWIHWAKELIPHASAHEAAGLTQFAKQLSSVLYRYRGETGGGLNADAGSCWAFVRLGGLTAGASRQGWGDVTCQPA